MLACCLAPFRCCITSGSGGAQPTTSTRLGHNRVFSARSLPKKTPIPHFWIPSTSSQVAPTKEPLPTVGSFERKRSMSLESTSSIQRIRDAARPRYYSISSDSAPTNEQSANTPNLTDSTILEACGSRDSPSGERGEEESMKRELLGFGLASDGQLAIHPPGDNNCVRMPEHIIGAPANASGASIRQIACGEKHTLILSEDGKMWSMGQNGRGQLGRGRPGTGSLSIYPVEFSSGTRVVQVACGREHSACITEDGRLFTWGDNSSGQLGFPMNETTVEKPRRAHIDSPTCQVACGPEHTLVLGQQGTVYVTGLQYDGASLHQFRIIESLLGIPITRIAAGGRHWVVVSASGSVFTWGQNDDGQLGTGDTTRQARPVRLENMSSMSVIEVACGDSHTVLLTKGGRVFSFGSDSFGQLGCGRKTTTKAMPSIIPEFMGTEVLRIAAGRCHTVVVVKGRVYAFGLNSSGQLGNGTTQNALLPMCLESCDQVSTIFSGWDHTFLVRDACAPDAKPGPSSRLLVPKSLTKQLVSDYLLKREKLDLMDDLQAVFSSLSLLNGSFLYNDDRRYNTSEANHGVNLDDVMDVLNSLAETSDAAQYADLIVDRCEESVFGPKFKPQLFLSFECIRPFLILPWISCFTKPKTREIVEKLHLRFAKAFCALTRPQQVCLNKWWRKFPVRHFNRLVSGLVAGVYRLVEDKAPGIHSLPLLTFLEELHVLNRVNNRIPLQNFYVNNLADKVNIREDYVKWVTTEGPNFFWAKYPFIMNGEVKGDLLHVEALMQQQRMINQSTVNLFGAPVFISNPQFHYRVRRDHIVEDTVMVIQQADQGTMLKPLRVEFVGEEAEDGGGVRKEYFMLLFQQILQAEYGMFDEDPDSHLTWFSGNPSEPSMFQMIGALVALAVYNHVLVAFPFPLALYKVLLKQPTGLDDFIELHPVEGKNLQSLLDYEGDDFEDVFGLEFSITQNVFGHPTTVELKPDGKETPVTQANKADYVKRYVQFRMEQGVNDEIEKQIGHFREGFTHVLHSRLLHLFHPRELMELVVGNENYDWEEFQKKTRIQYTETVE
ncbi:unnamed protein product, partial [Mesorhabditis spiculigera]